MAKKLLLGVRTLGGTKIGEYGDFVIRAPNCHTNNRQLSHTYVQKFSFSKAGGFNMYDSRSKIGGSRFLTFSGAFSGSFFERVFSHTRAGNKAGHKLFSGELL